METGVFVPARSSSCGSSTTWVFKLTIIPFHSKMQTIPRLCCRDNLFMARLDVFLSSVPAEMVHSVKILSGVVLFWLGLYFYVVIVVFLCASACLISEFKQ